MKERKALACRKCSAPLSSIERFCPACGATRFLTSQESRELGRRSTGELAMKAERKPPVPLYNPRAAIWWSVLLSPAFGATLHALNWKAMGEPLRFRFSIFWAAGSLLLFAVYPALRSIDVAEIPATNWSRIVTVAYILLWYVSAGRQQIAQVKDEYGSDYPRRSWWKAFLAVAGVLAAVLAMAFLMGAMASRPLNLPHHPAEATRIDSTTPKAHLSP